MEKVSENNRPGTENQRTRSMIVYPLLVFLGTFIVHFLYVNLFPEKTSAQTLWVTIPHSWSLKTYLEQGNIYLGFSYALSLAFAAYAFLRYRQDRLCNGKVTVIAGLSFTGLLSVLGCFLIGCCGSPMLIVYLNLFGAAFLPFTKPLIALLTVVFVSIGYWWLARPSRKNNTCCPAPE